MQTIDTKTLCELSGMEPAKVHRARAAGTLKPVISLGGRHSDQWSLTQCLAAAVARGVRALGVSPRDSVAVLDKFLAMSREKLEAQFADGRTTLLVVGGGCLPRLMPPEAAVANPKIDYRGAAAVGIRVAGVDVRRVWENILAAVEHRAKSEKSEPATAG